jgi:hypothetical protein
MKQETLMPQHNDSSSSHTAVVSIDELVSEEDLQRWKPTFCEACENDQLWTRNDVASDVISRTVTNARVRGAIESSKRSELSLVGRAVARVLVMASLHMGLRISK